MFCFNILRYLHILFFIIFLCSCSQKNTLPKLESVKKCTFPDNPTQNAPLWICYMDIEGYPIYGVGSVEKSKAGFQFMMQQATTQARIEIAQTLKTSIDNTIKLFAEENKIGDSETITKISQMLTSQITQNDLIGSKVLRTAVSNNGVLYVLVGLNEENYQTTIKNIFTKTSQANNSNNLITKQDLSKLENKFFSKWVANE